MPPPFFRDTRFRATLVTLGTAKASYCRATWSAGRFAAFDPTYASGHQTPAESRSIAPSLEKNHVKRNSQ